MSDESATSVWCRRDDIIIAWLTALAISVHLLESMLPSPLPGIKPGLANIIVTISLVWLGWRIAIWVSLLRVIISSFILGTFLTPTFILSFSGAAASLLALLLVSRLPGKGFGMLGLCVIGALAHISGQFWVAWWLFIPHPTLLNLYPVFLTAAFFLGTLGGLIAIKLLQRSRHIDTGSQN